MQAGPDAAAMVVELITDLIMAYVLARFVVHYGATVASSTARSIGFMAWLGFVATVTLASIFYETAPDRSSGPSTTAICSSASS